jgi:hypothetical protein
MSIVATIVWVITVGIGSFMVAVWRKRGGLSGDPAQTHLPPVRVFTHLGLALTGLVVWLVFLGTGSAGWAWAAVGALVLAAVLGGVMVRRWTLDGRELMRGGSTTIGSLAEQHIPRLPVVLHGVFAAATLVTVLVVALT